MCCFINYSNQISHHFGDTQLRKCLLCPNTPQMRKSWWVSLVIGWMDDNYKWNCFFYYISLLIVKYINSIGKFKFEYFVTWVEEAWKLYNFSLEILSENSKRGIFMVRVYAKTQKKFNTPTFRRNRLRAFLILMILNQNLKHKYY